MTIAPIQVTNHRYRLGYHLMAPAGWINDPNGLCYFQGYYHVFYQYHPYSATWGPMSWGHARSRDLLHWQTLPIAIKPDNWTDHDGCFSGSALIKDQGLYLLYTGNNYYNRSNVNEYWQNQNLAVSYDGLHFTKYLNNPVIAQPPLDNTENFRDPKVWEYDGLYYAVIGGQSPTGLGQLLFYQTADLKHWHYLGILAQAQTAATEGYMWECPDLFRLNGQDILLISPQGIQAQTKRFLNLYQTGYFVGRLDYQQPALVHGSFQELDQGHDFYAAQTMLTPDGRRILIGWLNMWDNEMLEQADGWAGALTLPRELVYKNEHLYQQPIAETKTLRQRILFNKSWSTKQTVTLIQGYSQLEINLKIDLTQVNDLNLNIKMSDPPTPSHLTLQYNQTRHQFLLYNFNRPGVRIAALSSCPELKLQIFLDTSSVEIFLNDGEAVLTERYYFQNSPLITLTTDKAADVQCVIYQLGSQTNNYHYEI